VTQPASGQVRQDKAILFVNEGAHHGVGPQRLWVQLARRWASQGHVVLRFDITGIGDSPVRPGQRDLTTYGPMAIDDVKEAVSFLRSRSGARSVTALGLCSGSYHIYMAAVLGARIDQLIPINQPVFQWEEGMSPDEADLHAAVVAHTARQAQATKDPRKWLGILTGEIPLQRVLDFAKRRLMLVAQQQWQALERRTGLKLPSQLALRLRKLARRGVQVHLIYGPDEMGYQTLMAEAAQEVSRLQAQGKLALQLIAEGNHVFSDSGPMQQLIRHLDNIVEVPPLRPVQTASHHALQ
jgi:dienelactone hydrolase